MGLRNVKTEYDIVELLALRSSTNESIGRQVATAEIAKWKKNLPAISSSLPLDSNCSNCMIVGNASEKSSKPNVQIWLEVESRCNISCRFCYNSWRGGLAKEPGQRSADEIVRGLVRLFEVVDCQLLSIAGGEPLLRKDLLEILKRIQHYSVPTALVTNGTLLTPSKISKLKGAGVRSFQISIHSHLEATHNRLSARNSWRKSLRAIVRLRESGIQVVPVFVATSENIEDFPDFVGLCNTIGLNQVVFNRFVPTGQGAFFSKEVGVPSYEMIFSTLRKADAIARGFGMEITLGVPVEVPAKDRLDFATIDWTSCPVYEGQSRWTIGADLQIRRCNSFTQGIGDLLGSGIDNLLFDLKRSPTDAVRNEFRSCRLLERPNLVQILRKPESSAVTGAF